MHSIDDDYDDSEEVLLTACNMPKSCRVHRYLCLTSLPVAHASHVVKWRNLPSEFFLFLFFLCFLFPLIFFSFFFSLCFSLFSFVSYCLLMLPWHRFRQAKERERCNTALAVPPEKRTLPSNAKEAREEFFLPPTERVRSGIDVS